MREDVLWVGVDDTDSREGGCTTWVAARLLDAFAGRVAGPPALVRLNPAVPWKTRGNAAVAFALDAGDLGAVLERAAAVVEAHAVRAEGTSPGLVVTDAPPPRAFYEAAVTRVVEEAEADALLATRPHRRWAGGRGRIGALAAIAWAASPGATTVELVAHRDPARWGTPRDVDAALVRKLDAEPGVFDCYDAEADEVVMAPSSPCPVLWGLRGTDAATVLALRDVLGPERPLGTTLFRTNHASDDHLVDATCADVRQRTAVRLAATVAALPRRIEGGHVLVEVEDVNGRATLAAYAPTRAFRDAVEALAPGDRVLACGGCTRDGTVNLEKFRLDAAPPRAAKPPPCCGRPLKARGRGDWRCRACGKRYGDAVAPAPAPGWYEVPPRARRHLARPLKLGLP